MHKQIKYKSSFSKHLLQKTTFVCCQYLSAELAALELSHGEKSGFTSCKSLFHQDRSKRLNEREASFILPT